ncbi:MAG: cytochrome c oxidase subunit II [Deltaproteobacteria bacterium]|jgi:cytochrome c oxidase subunit 2|nr:cytochrome c oxidase subunit II [Deltaproteobacteria bacterium]MBT4014778.1 cytochrome c oxidase subunit II [Deltaproteobacteria bacterium]MBT4630039.1 cytochrome c oxidase subunit II [Deltaproteobacteria bacterium]MBT5834884.1 cytochrome c oxidase subunit II [Deltaproteobacteria bacterium]
MIEYFIDSASSFSGDIDNLFFVITLIIGFWFFLVFGALVYFILKFRRKDGLKAQYITGEKHSETKWTHYPHYAVIAMDVFIIAANILVWVNIKQTLPPKDNLIRVIGQQWSWSFVDAGQDGVLDTEDDITTVNDLHVKVDETYHFELQSRDVLHNFSVPAFRLRQDAVPGRTITGWFKPTSTGSFDIQCAEMCGYGHGIMGAAITVHSEESYTTTIAQIRSGTYESHFQKRKGTKTKFPISTSQVEERESFAELLASIF